MFLSLDASVGIASTRTARAVVEVLGADVIRGTESVLIPTRFSINQVHEGLELGLSWFVGCLVVVGGVVQVISCVVG